MNDIEFSRTSSDLPDRATAIRAAKEVSTTRRHPVLVKRDDDKEQLVFCNGSLDESWFVVGRDHR